MVGSGTKPKLSGWVPRPKTTSSAMSASVKPDAPDHVKDAPGGEEIPIEVCRGGVAGVEAVIQAVDDEPVESVRIEAVVPDCADAEGERVLSERERRVVPERPRIIVSEDRPEIVFLVDDAAVVGRGLRGQADVADCSLVRQGRSTGTIEDVEVEARQQVVGIQGR